MLGSVSQPAGSGGSRRRRAWLPNGHSGQPEGRPIKSPMEMPWSSVKPLPFHANRVMGKATSSACDIAQGLGTYSKTLLAKFHAVRPEVQITALTRVLRLPSGPYQNPWGVRGGRVAPVIRSTTTATFPKRASRISSRSTEDPKAFTAMTNAISGPRTFRPYQKPALDGISNCAPAHAGEFRTYNPRSRALVTLWKRGEDQNQTRLGMW
jgi:hypothetical protein